MSRYNGKNVEIQLMRVLCISLVLVTHQGWLNTNTPITVFDTLRNVLWTSTGVDLFFVISGFFMGSMVLGRARDDFSLSDKVTFTLDFLRKRFLRLFPASFFWITVTLVVGCLSSNREIWGGHGALFFQWVTSVFCMRNFQNAIMPNGLGYYWSLSLEWQFYIVLPILFFLLGRKRFLQLIYVLAIILLFWSPGGENWRWFRSMGFVWGLIAWHVTATSAVADVIRRKMPRLSPWLSIILLIFSLLAITAMPQAFYHHMMVFAFSLVSIVGCVCVILIALQCGTFIVPRGLQALVYWGGELSYSIYLCHMVVWAIMQTLRQHYGWSVSSGVFTASGFVLAIICATFSYFLIERRFYKAKSLIASSEFEKENHESIAVTGKQFQG